ncbi:MAG: transposase [Chloroflexi bacterium]|nr:transposase [Chloroflexota bacterium]MBU1747307.1 transposase [Chloroflexota bacterium]
MTSYNELAAQPRKFLAMTGYTIAEFQALLPHFQAQFEQFIKTQTVARKPRTKRKHSAYKNSPLPTIADQLLFILIYLKQGSTQELHGTLFGMHQPDANRWIHLLHPCLNQALAALGELPVRDAAAFVPEDEELAIYFHDGTERPIPRPTDQARQKEYYSGKKKQHTVKNIVIINTQSQIRFLTPTCAGKKHDKKAADEAGYSFSEDSVLFQDTGFQGFNVAGVIIIQPRKKPRGQELTPADKETNRLIAQIRIRVEHAIGGVKRYRIVKDKIRCWKEGFRDKVMETCCGLHNFRLHFRPWHYEAVGF